MTKQQRIELATNHIRENLDSHREALAHEASLAATLQSFPIYQSLKKKYPNVPSSYEEFLAMRIPNEDEEEDAALYEWNYLHQWDINHAYWQAEIRSLQIKVDTLTKALNNLQTMIAANDPLLDCPSFYSDFLGSLRIDLTSEELQEFLDE